MVLNYILVGCPCLLLNSRPKYLYVTLRLCFRHCCICKGTRFNEKTILDVKTHFKQNEKTFQYTHFTSCRPQNFNGFALQTPLKQLLRKSFQFQKLLMDRGYPYNLIEKVLSEINSKKVCVPETKLNSKEEKDLPFSGNTNPKSLLI